jgi:hypothetical protein
MSNKKLALLAFACMGHAWPNTGIPPTQPTLSEVTQNTIAAQDSKLSPALAVSLNNAHDLEQKVVVTTPKKDPTDCTQLHGPEFMECMACQSSENFKKNLMACNDRMAYYYFVHLFFIEDYYEALQNFTEQEWQSFYESRQPQARENFPKTLKEQRAMLKALYIEAYFYNYLEYLFSSQSSNNTDDLEKLVRNFNIRRSDGYFFTSKTCNTLQNRFVHAREKLFTKPTL